MQVVMNFLGLHLLTQGMLLAAFFLCRKQILAVYALWEYDQTLVWFYFAGISTMVWLIWPWIRRYVLFRPVCEKAGEASRTHGF